MKFNLILIMLFLVSCGKSKIPACPECKIYAGDSSREAMVREQDQEYIYADSEEFDNMIGMTHEGFQAFVDTYISGCRTWKKNVKLVKPVKLYKQNRPQIREILKKK